MSNSTPLARGRCTERNTFAYPQINDLQVLFLVRLWLPSWRNALLDEIAQGRCVSSRGRVNPRGVKRKMSNYNVRHRGEKLHQKHEPVPVFLI